MSSDLGLAHVHVPWRFTDQTWARTLVTTDWVRGSHVVGGWQDISSLAPINHFPVLSFTSEEAATARLV